MPSKTQLGYVRLIGSLFGFLRDNATLRRASTIQFLLGISYGGFWATVAPMMLALHGFGPAQTGLLAIPAPRESWCRSRRDDGPTATEDFPS